MADTERSAPIMDDNLASPRTGSGIRRRCWNALSVISFSQGVIIICVFVFSTVYFQGELTSVRKQLGDSQQKMSDEQQKMDAQLEGLKILISQRLNATVELLDSAVLTATTHMNEQVEMVNENVNSMVNAQLNQTIQEFDNTVSNVTKNVNNAVNKVNEDVSTENSWMAYQFAGTFTIFSVFITVYHISTHIQNYNEPFIQRKVVAILWMCPVYSVTTWLSLVFLDAEEYLTIIRDFYEAYVIYIFLSFLVAVLGRGDRNAAVDVLANHADHLKPPISLVSLFRKEEKYKDDPRGKADAVLFQCQKFTMQFVFFKPISSIAMAVSNALYHGSWDYKSPQFYITAITNLSVFLAVSGLVKFYQAVYDDLSWCRPFPKFVCIKGVVFMTFWQHMTINILATSSNNFDNEKDARDWSSQANSFLICLEMFILSIANYFFFPMDEWTPDYRPQEKQKRRVGDNIAFQDFVQDVKLLMTRRKRHKRPTSASRGSPSHQQLPTTGIDSCCSTPCGSPIKKTGELSSTDPPLNLNGEYYLPELELTELPGMSHTESPTRATSSKQLEDYHEDDHDIDGDNWDRIEKFIETTDLKLEVEVEEEDPTKGEIV